MIIHEISYGQESLLEYMKNKLEIYCRKKYGDDCVLTFFDDEEGKTYLEQLEEDVADNC